MRKEVIKMIEKVCKNCRYRKNGYCNCFMLLQEELPYKNGASISSENATGGVLEVGPNFGCVNFDERKDNEL